MTIKTLHYIHDLLIEAESHTKTMLDWARQARNAAEDEGNESELARKQVEYDNLYRRHDTAYRALQDFETHEF